MINNLKLEIRNSIEVKEQLYNNTKELVKIENLIFEAIKSIKARRKLIFCGNGGSFADSQHLTAEFISRLRIDRNPLPAICLGTNSSNLTAIANDYGYQNIFLREMQAVGEKGDLFIPISTSGNSENILEVIKKAKEMGLTIVGLTGEIGGKMSQICDTINIPTMITEKIQECHIMVGHIVCAQIEKTLFQ